MKALEGGVWKTRIAESEPAKGLPALAWRRGGAQSGLRQSRAAEIEIIGRETMRQRGELVERSFAHILDRGGMRRPGCAGPGEPHKRYLIHVAGFNLGVLMPRHLRSGNAEEAAETLYALIIVLKNRAALVFGLIAAIDGELAAIVIVAADPTRN